LLLTSRGCFDDKQIDGYRNVAKRVQAQGGLFIVQIFHAGMRSEDKLIEGPARTAVDTVYKHRGGTRDCKGLTEAEIEQLIKDFVTAAKRLESAGVDGVEIHGAHGYILTQFLCPTLNTRKDKWGGTSLENRARLTREVTQRIRAAVSKDFIVGIRLSAEPGQRLIS
jgi:2,4-dienoyl-CoA reductase-like NADH-dependent reductase (Old Yellow Enzyme family)